MKRMRILVVEDDPFLVISLEQMIFEAVPADVIVATTVAVAERELMPPHFDFAFLDVNLRDGKSYRVAEILADHGIAFAFVSGAPQDKDIPAHLRHVPFIPKPYDRDQIGEVLHDRR